MDGGSEGGGADPPAYFTWLSVGSECSGSAVALPLTQTAGSPPPQPRSRRPRSAAQSPASQALRRRKNNQPINKYFHVPTGRGGVRTLCD